MNHSSNKSMWWMMAGCLLLPLAIILFSLRGKAGGLGSNWGFLVIVGAFVIMHVLMMFGGHGHDRSEENNGPVNKPQDQEAQPQTHKHN